MKKMIFVVIVLLAALATSAPGTPRPTPIKTVDGGPGTPPPTKTAIATTDIPEFTDTPVFTKTQSPTKIATTPPPVITTEAPRPTDHPKKTQKPAMVIKELPTLGSGPGQSSFPYLEIFLSFLILCVGIWMISWSILSIRHGKDK